MEKEVSEDLEFVNNYQKEIILLSQANALLDWDREVYMPKLGINSRAEQSALLSEIIHKRMIEDRLFSVLRKLKSKGLKGKNRIMVNKLYKDVSNARKIPKEFVSAIAKAVTLGNAAWLEARRRNDFFVFKDRLEKIVSLKQEYAKYIGLKGHLYNSLLDYYEEGMTVETLKPLFFRLKEELVKLLKKIESMEKYKKQKRLLSGEFSKEKQIEFVNDVIKRIGLAKEKSRIDFSEHPFTTKIGLGDVRITTAIRDKALFAFESSIHEAGHALYEIGLPEEDAFNVLGEAPSLGIHESQSRFWENMIGKSKDFWKFYFPKFKKEFNLNLDFDSFFREINFVFPGKIRVESDEVHYCLHVILRFEIELGLISGEIAVKDLPRIWNSKMKEFFGVKVKNDVEGCLQDVHWSNGLIGYFPTYALGSIYAAQIFDAMQKDFDVNKKVEKGEFKKIKEWLKERIHKYGSMYFADEIIKKTCGKGLDVKVYLNYLTKKYGEIYGF